MPQEDKEKVFELIRHRPYQFCLLMKALLGTAQMELVMREALEVATGKSGKTSIAEKTPE